ncbi:MAG: bifunctional precorrin-2 dehydrogenase/sirohydrochlorin ferrochelatase [Firmicutes bacterium]|nr:bifunctional precorrin-2 dehydrogenase/sirohydrochlorin ferrochelatase [Bacillota bacterium]
MERYFPIMLDLAERSCLVVGGGKVAERKVGSLLECGAKVTVVSPELVEGLARLAAEGRIVHLPRGYEPGDCTGMFVVIAATDDQAVNEAVAGEARESRCLVNVVDCAAESNFIVPAVARQGALTLAISTGGASPALARRLREDLEEHYGPEYAVFLALMARLRAEVLRRYPPGRDREELFRRLVDSQILAQIRNRDTAGIRLELWNILGKDFPAEELTAGLSFANRQVES